MVSLSIPWLRGTVDPVSSSSDGCQTLLSMGEWSGGDVAGLVAGLAWGVKARLVAGLVGVGGTGHVVVTILPFSARSLYLELRPPCSPSLEHKRALLGSGETETTGLFFAAPPVPMLGK